jgi:hypothetical protein
MNWNRLRAAATWFVFSACLLLGCVDLEVPSALHDEQSGSGGQAAMAGSIGSGGALLADASGPDPSGGSGGNATQGGRESSGGRMATGGAAATGGAEPDPADSGAGSTDAKGTGGAVADGAIDTIQAAADGSPSSPDTAILTTGDAPGDTAQDLAVDFPSPRDTGGDPARNPDASTPSHDASAPDAAAPPDLASARGPIVYYPCEQASGTSLPDLSGNDHSAVLVGAFAFSAGKVGNALSLTPVNQASGGAGSGYAVLPVGLLSAATEMTIATCDKVNNNAGWARVFDFGNDTSKYMFLTPSNGLTGKLRFGISLAGNASGVEQDMEGPAALATGVWKHLAVVIGSAGGRLYVDGVQVGTNSTMTLRPNSLGSTMNNWIGRSQFTSDPYLDGLIDDFRIYDRALSDAEIAALFKG